MENSPKIKEAMEKALDKIKNMTPEEFMEKVLCLNGIMTTELFDKVINEVIRKKHIDDEDLWYCKKDYKINGDEFLDVFHYIEEAIDSKEVGEVFETHEGFFNHQGQSFKWWVMIGQGSISSLQTIVYDSQYQEIKIDPEIRFYKRLNE